MHELSYVTKLVDQAISYLKEDPLKEKEHVEALVVDVGETTGVIPEWLCRYYDDSIKNTVLEGSRLDITVVPVKIQCSDCKSIYLPEKENGYVCPICGSKRGKIVSGREFLIRKIIIKEDDT